jgi:hypothetical protein
MSSGVLLGCSVLISTTRVTPYQESEIKAILNFVHAGGGLLIMSNHGDLPGKNRNDFTRHDRVLAMAFGINIQCAWFATPGVLTQLSGQQLNVAHPILAGFREGEAAIDSIVTNNCRAISANSDHWLARLSLEMVDERSSCAPGNLLFAHALEDGERRVVTLADSGFVGTQGTTQPGPGLIQQGSNSAFVANVIRWLSRQL